MSPGSFEERSSKSPSTHSPSTGEARRAELTLTPVPGSVPKARRFVASLDFAGGSDPERLALLTAEIVTNAILHARTPLKLEAMEMAGRGVRVSVTDGNTNPPVKKDYGPSSPTGRGLHIVEAMADRWGFESRASGKTVWFELGFEDGSD
ncbi:MAG TPA: ATP-binding protein [Acidimicrobiia bacterium]|nr:ATP-binding protein [Acidimicrobiia bacterium]